MPKYLNADGVRLMVQTLVNSIKSAFTLKSDAVKSIRRDGTTFTATRADGTTFTFDQQDSSVEKSSTTPLENGTAAVGDENRYAAGNHVHPHDSTKVDKVVGKGLSSNDYTGEEKEKLGALPTASGLSDALGQKVDKVAGKGLSTNDYTSEDKSKLGALPSSADLTSSLGNKVDKVSGKGLSTNDYTTEDKSKLENLPDVSTLSSTYAKKSEITNMYKYKGSVANAGALPSSGQAVGDVYNIETASIYGGAGMNVAWNGSLWDPLGEIFVLSSITTAEIDEIAAN